MTNNRRHFFTSESVTEGHPDKVADQISDAVLDEILKDDKKARVACEVLLTTGVCVVAGEITTSTYVDIPKIVRSTLHDIGYRDAAYGIGSEHCGVIVAIDEQSPDIAMGVNEEVGGAGDQGMMFGFACSETEELMPLPIMLAHKMCRQLAHVRKERIVPYLRPDGKSQVTVEYEGKKPIRVDQVVVAAQHEPGVPHATLEADIKERVIYPVIHEGLRDIHTKYHVNPTGKFEIGGPQGDTGLTGRKIIVDTYGGYARHGGGAFSGKDPTKVDRSGAYMMRYVAKNIVAAGLAERCELQVAYVIGERDPLSLRVDTFGTNTIAEEKIEDLVRKYFDLTPRGMINKLNLRQPMYRKTAAYGHFGRTDLGVTWEQTDFAEILRSESAA